MTRAHAVAVAALVLAGCAGSRQTQAMLDGRRGRMTYDEAVRRYGPPIRCDAEGPAKTCTWVYGTGGSFYAPFGDAAAMPRMQPPTMELTFTNGVLSDSRLWGSWR
ncbi:MAG: hypothetical protein HY927_05080 [Elusimicrobia bacterium]|nr:hypothetical protein [Elusimicrobiota bacterium]